MLFLNLFVLAACVFAVNPNKKYVKINGVTKLNPEYNAWELANGGKGTSLSPAEASQALPIVSSMEDYVQYNNVADPGQERPFASSTEATMEMLQESDISSRVGLPADAIIDQLGEIFSRYEIPIGMMNKLMELMSFDALHFIIDDSGSMASPSDNKNLVTGKLLSRWEEAHTRLKSMIEILAYVPTPMISIRFLNRLDRIELHHNIESPLDFINSAYAKIDSSFSKRPSGTSPFAERISDTLSEGGRIARYIFGDGQPNGGAASIASITQMITNRRNPQENPMTCISCTNEDSEVEWMKELEEIAPYTAEFDDYEDEKLEVLRDQGSAFPFSRGFYLVGQICAAMNPDDLDAMDESVPFTKSTLDNLLGVEYSMQEYRHYFVEFLRAQQIRTIQSPADQVKKEINWDALYDSFVSAKVAKDIPAVAEFKRRLHAGVAVAPSSGMFGSFFGGGQNAAQAGSVYNGGVSGAQPGSSWGTNNQASTQGTYPNTQAPSNSGGLMGGLFGKK